MRGNLNNYLLEIVKVLLTTNPVVLISKHVMVSDGKL